MDNEQENVVPKYATLFYDVRAELDITWVEYIYLDMVYHLSHAGWCIKSLENCGKDLGLDRSNVYRMRQRLIEKGLIIKGTGGKVKTSVIYAKRIQSTNPRSQNATPAYAKRNSSVVKTQHKNYIRITNRINDDKDFRGIESPAKERIRAMLKEKVGHGL